MQNATIPIRAGDISRWEIALQIGNESPIPIGYTARKTRRSLLAYAQELAATNPRYRAIVETCTISTYTAREIISGAARVYFTGNTERDVKNRRDSAFYESGGRA
jgi:hypothetical protein